MGSSIKTDGGKSVSDKRYSTLYSYQPNLQLSVHLIPILDKCRVADAKLSSRVLRQPLVHVYAVGKTTAHHLIRQPSDGFRSSVG